MVKRNSKSLIVEKFPAPEEPKTVSEVNEKKEIYLTISDVLDMLAGYSMDAHPLVKLSKSNDSGTCKLCGKSTNAAERKICWECHKDHMKNIYHASLDVNMAGMDGFIYKY